MMMMMVTGMNAHAHSGDVDRVSAYVRLECHGRGGGGMREGRLGGIVGAEQLAEIGVLLGGQWGTRRMGRGVRTERSSSKSLSLRWVASCCKPATMLCARWMGRRRGEAETRYLCGL